MDCNHVRQYLLDLAGKKPVGVPGDVQEHVQACPTCSRQLASLRATMSLLEEWQAAEPSPYFDSRLRARLREEAAHPEGWLAWFRKPALAVAMAALVAIGIGLVRGGPRLGKNTEIVQQKLNTAGSAVADLQALDKNEDLYADFEVLDDIPVQNGAQQNPLNSNP